MSNSIRDEIEGALEELEADLSDQTLSLPGGGSLPCIPSMEDVGTQIQIGQQVEEITCVVHVRKSLFITSDLTTITSDSTVVLSDNNTPRLRSGKKPSFREKTYRVLKVSEDPTGAYFKIFMGSAR